MTKRYLRLRRNSHDQLFPFRNLALQEPVSSVAQQPHPSTAGLFDQYRRIVRTSAETPIQSLATRERLLQAIAQAAGQYFRLVILAGSAGSGKTGMLQALMAESGYPLLNVNLELSRRMLELSNTQRARQAERLLKEVLAELPGEVALLDNLEILFDPRLAIQPLRQLQVLSRNRTIVASWNGHYMEGTLTYAEPGHPEYARFHPVEAVVVTIEGPTSV